MKKDGILNAQLSRIIAGMGHTDKLVIGDCGLPIPVNSELVDLALSKNIPRFIDTLRIVLQELKVEDAVVAAELLDSGSSLFKEIESLLPGVNIRNVSHEEFKELTRSNTKIAFVRTGEATPYANIILFSGVTF
jgi:D-ribose pyranase